VGAGEYWQRSDGHWVLVPGVVIQGTTGGGSRFFEDLGYSMKVAGLEIHFHEDSKGVCERGPVYGTVPLLDSLLLTDTVSQAMPCRRELIEVRKKSERTVAAYEVLLWYFLAANRELGESNEERHSLAEENAALKEALKRARVLALRPSACGFTMRQFAEEIGITPTQLSAWTGDPITTPPQFVD